MSRKRLAFLILAAALAAIAVFFFARRERPAPKVAAPVAAAPAPPVAPAAGPAVPQKAAVAGRVTDGGGAPLAGAVVRLAPDGREGVPATARSGADGTFRIADLRPGTWRAGASAVGFLPAHVDGLVLRAGQETPLTLKLEAGGRPISGTVSDRTGGPVAGALVEVIPLHGFLEPRDSQAAAAFTDEAGRYKVHVADGIHRAQASHPDYVGEARVLDVGTGGATVDFALLPGGVIEGVVREHGSGAPVGGARVDYDRESLAGMAFGGTMSVGRRRGSVTADEGGRFRVAGLEAGAIRMTAHAPGKASREPTVVPMGVAGQVTGVDVFVGGAYAVRGRVTFQGAGPAADADVWVQGPAGRAAAVTDAQGRFAVEGLPPGVFRLGADAEGALPPERLRSVELRDKDVEGVELTLVRGAYVEGRVEPAELAEVSLRLDPKMPGPGRMVVMGQEASTVTGDGGAFRLGPLPAGKTRIGARAADGRRGEVEVEVVPAGVRGVVIRLLDAGGIAGKVVDEAGAPPRGAVVTIKRAGGDDEKVTMVVNGIEVGAERAPVGPDGRYAVKGLAAGDYEVNVQGDDGEPLALAKGAKAPRVTLKVDEQKSGVDLVVEARDGVLRGVVQAPDGKPLADAWVSATLEVAPPAPAPGGKGQRTVMRAIMVTEEGGGEGGAARALTGEDGRFEITGLRRGKYRLLGEGLGGAARGMLAGAETGSDVTLRLAMLRKLEGKVTFGGKPVAEMSVELDGVSSRQQTFRDAAGAFVIDRVDPGKYHVRVSAAEGGGEADVVVPDDPAAPPTTTVTIALSANGRVVGRVLKPDSSAMAGAAVLTAADTGDGKIRIAIEGEPPTTGADGSFALDMAPGKYVLLVMAEVGSPPAVRHPFNVNAGQVVDLGALRAQAGPPRPPGPPPPGP